MNEQQSRRVQKLIKIDMRAEHPPDLILKFVNDSITLDSRIQKLSDKVKISLNCFQVVVFEVACFQEAIDVIIAKDDFDAKSVGVMYHILTCGENQELFARVSIRIKLQFFLTFSKYRCCDLSMVPGLNIGTQCFAI